MPIDTIEKVDKVTGLNSTKELRMPADLEKKVDLMTSLQKRYADYRSKGLRQADAALKAGSEAKGRASLGRVGYNLEQVDGMKEYISYLYEKRARAAVVDEIEIIEGLRANIEAAMELGRIDWANKSLELMGQMIGAFKAAPQSQTKEAPTQSSKNNINAFKDGETSEEVSQDEKLKRIQMLMGSMAKTKVD